ncbi:MAG TPA: NACHT domain-containing protein [Methylomusa anaerophila]|uniref:NACHT domain protein n=1 Tax=Methylomusa anaerophila TaxID=1930071 RepID=A0A348AKQ0_9FIRM|nr:NACHT domain-containing protein [Methylomusa anaerophila]BBB91648.1 NACHT domain protein [Methylomusa anaerophila]HML88618.1 NACHT domain-containing protein [Methylomusa anaerophila]
MDSEIRDLCKNIGIEKTRDEKIEDIIKAALVKAFQNSCALREDNRGDEDNKNNNNIESDKKIHIAYKEEGKNSPSGDFDPSFKNSYLTEICERHQKKKSFYIRTNVENQSPSAEDESPFNFKIDIKEMNDQPSNKEKKIIEAVEGIRKYADQHVLLVGKPGSGKSTALKQLLYEEAAKHKEKASPIIPIYIELRHMPAKQPEFRQDKNEQDLVLLIKKWLISNGNPLPDNNIVSCLKKGEFLILFDGINELPSEYARNSLKNFKDTYNKCPMVFTTRMISSFEYRLGIVNKFEIQLLTPEQIEKYVTHYFPKNSQIIIAYIYKKFKELCQTPLFLEMVCAVVYDNQNKLPENTGQLFRRFIETYETGHKDFIYWNIFPSPGDLLQELSFHMMTTGDSSKDIRLTIPPDEVEIIWEKYLVEEKIATEGQIPIKVARRNIESSLNIIYCKLLPLMNWNFPINCFKSIIALNTCIEIF